MKLRFIPLFVVTLLAAATLGAAGLAGKWTTEFESQIGVQKYVFEFTGDGASLAGKAAHEHSLSKGEVALQDIRAEGDKVSFVEPFTLNGTTVIITYSGTLAQDTMNLKRQVGDFATEQIVVKRSGTEAPAGQARSATGNRSQQAERVAASFLLALGRLPSATETAQWGAVDASVADLIAKHRQLLAADATVKCAVVAKAFADSFGRAATDEEITKEAAVANATYTELMQHHVEWLGAHADSYEKILNRAYQLVIRRDVYPEEIEYWKKKDPQSFAVLVGCIDNWGRRNQPGLMVTAGPAAVSVNCVFLTTLRLSPAVAAEARAAAGLGPVADAAAGTHLLAAGAEKIVSDGRIHFAAVLKD